MGRRKLTEEELLQKQQEKEQQKQQEKERVNDFKEGLSNTIMEMDDKLLLDFIKKAKEYDGLDQKALMELIFKKFANGDFTFKTVVHYE